MKQQNSLTRRCPRCRVGSLLSGNESRFNARSDDGKQICGDCKVKEIYSHVLEKRD